MPGPLKTLFQALQASSFITAASITLAFGEEAINDMTQPLPYVVMVPRSGITTEPGYAVDGSAGSEDILTKPPGIDLYTESLWQVTVDVQFYVWAEAAGNLPVDNADAIETARLALLSALRDQRAQSDGNGNVYYGLGWKPVSETWMTMQDAVARAGKGLVMTVQVYTPVVMAPPTGSEVTVQTTQFNPSINNQPG